MWFGCLYGASYTEPTPVFLVWLIIASLIGFVYIILGIVKAAMPQGTLIPAIRPILGGQAGTAAAGGATHTGNPATRTFGKKKEALPSGWVAAQDPKSGQTYYVHKKTNKTQWEKPTA